MLMPPCRCPFLWHVWGIWAPLVSKRPTDLVSMQHHRSLCIAPIGTLRVYWILVLFQVANPFILCDYIRTYCLNGPGYFRDWVFQRRYKCYPDLHPDFQTQITFRTAFDSWTLSLFTLQSPFLWHLFKPIAYILSYCSLCFVGVHIKHHICPKAFDQIDTSRQEHQVTKFSNYGHIRQKCNR